MVTQMIQLYCRGNHHTGSLMCSECQKLAEYASMRSDKCPFMETKTFCSNCKVHCYKPDMRDKIKAVMRYSRSKDDITSSCRSSKTPDIDEKRKKTAG